MFSRNYCSPFSKLHFSVSDCRVVTLAQGEWSPFHDVFGFIGKIRDWYKGKKKCPFK